MSQRKSSPIHDASIEQSDATPSAVVELPEIPEPAARMILESYSRQAQAQQATQALVGVVIATLGLDPATHGVRIDGGTLRVVRTPTSGQPGRGL